MDESRVVKILVADSHQIVAHAIATVLDSVEDFQVVGYAKSGQEIFSVFESFTPNVVIMDIDLPGSMSGLEVVRRIRQMSSSARIIALTNLVDDTIIHDALREGVLSYLLKHCSIDELIQSIRSAHRGIPTLSPEITSILIRQVSAPESYALTLREREILELIALGLNNHEIGEQLSISLSTVQFHVSNILNKLGVQNRIQAATFAVRHKLAS